ncbi:MAG: aminoglycoside phosphotransferase family protein [Rickettsiales bacterium]|jgi:aminoglycoside phosphotransferase (APT) family kinase protein|nr:aminoglycoside phosphotransferase family protein [Rickettsiales bacterium]
MFRHDEDFADIILRATGERPLSLELIPTGWTNVVFQAGMPDGDFFFRFPRDPFWDEMMLKDFAFCGYIRGKVSCATPDMRLLYDGGRPFSMHRKIEGRSLQGAFPTLGESEAKRAARGMAEFIAEIQKLDPAGLPKDCGMRLSEFFRRLTATHFDRLDTRHYERLLAYEKSPCVVHGDLNPSNVIIDDSGNVAGVIDFCFAGIGGKTADVARIVGRSPPAFGEMFLSALGIRKNGGEIRDMIDTWNYVEMEYIGFIKGNHPEIALPDGV